MRVIESFGEIEWGGCGPTLESQYAEKEAHKLPHSTKWRYKNPNSQLNRLLVEAVNSFKGEIEWEIVFKGRNWFIAPKRKREFAEENRMQKVGSVMSLMKEKEPEIGILSNQEVPKLAEHIKNYVKKRWQSNL